MGYYKANVFPYKSSFLFVHPVVDLFTLWSVMTPKPFQLLIFFLNSQFIIVSFLRNFWECSIFCGTYLILSYSQTHPKGIVSTSRKFSYFYVCISVSVWYFSVLKILCFVSSEYLISMCLFLQEVTNETKQGWFQNRPWGALLVTLLHYSHCTFQYQFYALSF